MTLPWLKKKMNTPMSSIVQKTDGSLEPMSEDQEGLKAAAEDLLMAIESKNASQVASALQAAFEICDSYEPKGEENE